MKNVKIQNSNNPNSFSSKKKYLSFSSAFALVAIQLLGNFIIPQAAMAQNVAQTNSQSNSQLNSQTSVAKLPEVQKETKPFILGLAAQYSQKNAVEETKPRENDFSLTFLPVYKINDTFTVGAKSIFTYNNYGPKDSTLSNTLISLGIKGYKFNESFVTNHSLSTTLVTNKESQEVDRLRAGFGISNGLIFTSSLIDAEYKLGLSKNIHEYNFNAEGKANIEYRISNSLEVKFPITQKFYLSSLGIYRIGYTYQKFQRYSYEWHSDLNFDATEKLSFNLGISNDGSALKANGVDSNISAFDENTSSVRAGVSMTL